MYLPSIFDDNFVDSFFDDMFRMPMEETTMKSPVMSTDIKDLGNGYEMDIELPGYTKDQVHASLHDGYLTITADKKEEKNDKDEDGTFLHQERYEGKCSRTFYVGENITEADIKAAFDNGVLKLAIPKKAVNQEVEQNRYIPIE